MHEQELDNEELSRLHHSLARMLLATGAHYDATPCLSTFQHHRLGCWERFSQVWASLSSICTLQSSESCLGGYSITSRLTCAA